MSIYTIKLDIQQQDVFLAFQITLLENGSNDQVAKQVNAHGLNPCPKGCEFDSRLGHCAIAFTHKIGKVETMIRDIGVGVCLLVVDPSSKRLLVGERIGNFGRGYLACPGGHQEKDEHWEQTALRELVEEAGTDLKVIIRPNSWPTLASESTSPLFVTNSILANGAHYITIWLRGEWQSGEPKNAEPTKKKEWEWMTLAQINDDPRMRPGVEAWIAGKFHDALHWLPLPEIHRYRDKLGL